MARAIFYTSSHASVSANNVLNSTTSLPWSLVATRMFCFSFIASARFLLFSPIPFPIESGSVDVITLSHCLASSDNPGAAPSITCFSGIFSVLSRVNGDLLFLLKGSFSPVLTKQDGFSRYLPHERNLFLEGFIGQFPSPPNGSLI